MYQQDGTYLSTCAIDVVLEPLATWLLLLALLIAIPLTRRRYLSERPRSTIFPPDAYSSKKPKSLLRRILTWVYYLLIVAMLAMLVLEIARLATSGRGVGLLPASLVGVLLAAGMHHFSTGIRDPLRVVIVVFWILMIVSMALRLKATNSESLLWAPVTTGNDYPASDQVIDVAVMVGVITVLAMLDIAL